ncbi:MAG: hypothetical protein HOO06_00910 [Bdellovibrionaceae bacterium]|jgi:hypothetical protein|nr:hypothetical protein [Pseudobdellovibrionaceae bacterium]
MKYFCFIIAIGFQVVTTQAAITELSCELSENYQLMRKSKLKIKDKTSMVFYDKEAYRINIKSLGGNTYEYEFYDRTLPSKYYTTGVLNESNNLLKFETWSRDLLISFKCRR